MTDPVYIDYDDKEDVIPLPTPDVFVPPTLPDPPPNFNEIKPNFSANLEKVTKYSYFFGIDELKINYNDISDISYFTSPLIPITISHDTSLKEYIKLSCDYYSNENSSIEFFIIDGTDMINIIPLEDTIINNEKIILNKNNYKNILRFEPDTSESITIKKNGFFTNLTLDNIEIEIKNNPNNIYTVNYTPKKDDLNKSYTIYNLKNPSVRVHAIFRLYDKTSKAPYINNISLRKYGGNALWLE